MDCIVTAGPTYEPLDQVRRLTNLSTGRLGSELASFLTGQGHRVHLLLGEQATCPRAAPVARLETFTTTADLRVRLRAAASPSVHAVFHAAAVSDFAFGKIFQQSPSGELLEIKSGKIPSQLGPLLVELIPTPKIIAELRDWFPCAYLVGWKYQVEGKRAAAVEKGRQQINETRSNACVANGPAYGLGFGLVTSESKSKHLRRKEELFEGLAQLIKIIDHPCRYRS